MCPDLSILPRNKSTKSHPDVNLPSPELDLAVQADAAREGEKQSLKLMTREFAKSRVGLRIRALQTTAPSRPMHQNVSKLISEYTKS